MSMLNPQVLLCENPPRFKAAIRGSLSRQRFILFGFHCVAVTSCVLPIISTCYDCWLFIDLLPRNAATVSSSNTELKIIESGLKDSEEKLYQPPDSGGKVLFIFVFFLSFQYFNHLRCARDFHVCVKKTKKLITLIELIFILYFKIHARVFHLGLVYCLYGFVSFNELWDKQQRNFPPYLTDQ